MSEAVRIDDAPCVAPPPKVRRIKFDRWLFDRDIDNVQAAQLVGAHKISIGRWRKLFDDPSRAVPNSGVIRRIEQLTDGEVRFEDWYRPCDVSYASPVDAGAAQ